MGKDTEMHGLADTARPSSEARPSRAAGIESAIQAHSEEPEVPIEPQKAFAFNGALAGEGEDAQATAAEEDYQKLPTAASSLAQESTDSVDVQKTPRNRGGTARARGKARGKVGSRGNQKSGEPSDAGDQAQAEGLKEDGVRKQKGLPRRTSKRERAKPQAYSPTHQDKETKLRREKVKQQERELREGSAAQSDEIHQSKRPRKLVAMANDSPKAGEATDDDSDDEDVPLLKLSARPSEQRAVKEQDTVAVKVESGTAEPAASEDIMAAAGTSIEEPNIAAMETNQEPDYAAGQEIEEPNMNAVETVEQILPPVGKAAEPVAAVQGRIEENTAADSEQQQADAVNTGTTEVPPPEPSPTNRQTVKPAADSDHQSEAAAAAEQSQEPGTAAGGKMSKSRKHSHVLEGLDSDDDDGARQNSDKWEPNAAAAAEARQSTSVESDESPKGGQARRKRLRKADAPAHQQRKRAACPADAEPAAKRSRKSGEGAGKPTPEKSAPPPWAGEATVRQAVQEGQPTEVPQAQAAARPKNPKLPTKDASQGGNPSGRAKPAESGQPVKPDVLPPLTGSTPKERLARDVARRNERLASGLRQAVEIFQHAQQQASEVLAQMAADIIHLENQTMTEELLQQTGIGKTMRGISKPWKPLQQATDVERKAGALLSRWMKAFQKEVKPAQPVTQQTAPAAALGGKSSTPGAILGAPAAQTATQVATQVATQSASLAQQITAPSNQTQTGIAQRALTREAQAQRPKPPAPAPGVALKQPKLEDEGAKPPQIAAPFAQAGSREEQTRSKARMLLEYALMPAGTVISPASAARLLEHALHEHYKEDDLASGKRYLRQLHFLWNRLAPEGECYQPGLMQTITSGKLHPADVVILSAEMKHLTQPRPLDPTALMPPPPPVSLPPQTNPGRTGGPQDLGTT